jgi:hypothetical protein
MTPRPPQTLGRPDVGLAEARPVPAAVVLAVAVAVNKFDGGLRAITVAFVRVRDELVRRTCLATDANVRAVESECGPESPLQTYKCGPLFRHSCQ